MKRVLLVNPPETEQAGYSNPPLGLLYLAGTLEASGGEVRLADGCVDGLEGISKAIKEFRPDIVGITCLTPARKQAIDAARMAKTIFPDVITVLGGVHPTIMYGQILEHYPFVDICVIGEGESSLLAIAAGERLQEIPGIAYRESGKVAKTAPRVYEKDLDRIAFPAWHLCDLSKYPARGRGVFNGVDLEKEPRVSVIFSRGCSGHCDFCSTWWIWRGWRCRSAANMADELEFLYRERGVRHFAFADDSFTVDRERILALCGEISRRGLKIAFHATTRTDKVDPEMLSALKAAGCYNIAFGIETASPSLLLGMRKENTIAASERAIAMCRSAGIKVSALMIAGSEGETWDTISETVSFLRRNRPDEVGCVGGLWVLPGTRLYRSCVERGLINDDFWLGDEPYMLYTQEHGRRELERMRDMITHYDTLLYKIAARLKRMTGWTV